MRRFLSPLLQRRELEADLAHAAEVQASLTPRSHPSLLGFDLAARCLAARKVGGDFYDWQETAPGVVALSIGDVMGKGMAAALLMATVRAALRAAACCNPPAVVMQVVARALHEDLQRSGSFVTVLHGQLDVVSRRLEYVDAGHGYAFVQRADGAVERLTASSNLPLGISLDLEDSYREDWLTLNPGDTLVLYSDGLIEEQPWLALAPDVLAAQMEGASKADEMVDRLLAFAGTAGHPSDDLTVVVLHCHRAGEARDGEAGRVPAAARDGAKHRRYRRLSQVGPRS